jgi:GR25 family glycosyltransferase involved in LPS biosynthesis
MYVMCNPEYEPVRYQFLVGHFARIGIPSEKIHWVQKVWGHQLTSDQVFSVYDPFTPRFGMKINLSLQSVALSRGEISLILTFREAVRKILEAGHKEVIIFESDVMLRKDFLPRLEAVLKGCSGFDWDYVSLGEGVTGRPPGHEPSYFGEQRIFPAPGQFVFRCCDSMLFRRSFLEKIWGTLVPFREPLDWEMNVQMLVHRGVPLWADPPLAEPGTARGRFVSSLPA